MTLQQVLELILRVKLTPADIHGQAFHPDREITRAHLVDLIDAGKLEWQDHARPDCGLGDGIDYVVWDDAEHGELFVSVDRAENLVCVC